jgi:hypothetical protein
MRMGKTSYIEQPKPQEVKGMAEWREFREQAPKTKPKSTSPSTGNINRDHGIDVGPALLGAAAVTWLIGQ